MTLNTRHACASALWTVLALSMGCDDGAGAGTGDGGGTGSSNGSGNDGGGSSDGGGDSGTTGAEPYVYEATLVPILAADDSEPIATPHEIIVLDSATGEPLMPRLSTMSEAGTGKISLTIPAGILPSYHVIGSGMEDSDTYDTIALNVPANVGDPLLRISAVGTAALAGNTAMFTAMQDRAALAGAVYWAPGGRRMGAVGCAKVYLDDDTTGADENTTQRYNGASLPVPIATQDQTNRSGRFYFGNMTTGTHTLRASLDDGETFLGEPIEFVVPRAREDALGPAKLILYQIGIDLDLDANPTPEDCPTM